MANFPHITAILVFAKSDLMGCDEFVICGEKFISPVDNQYAPLESR